jgi:7-cyano-7-deazaguanine synthase
MSGRAILLSGGVDSAALAALVRPERAIAIDYGQVCARAEITAAGAVAAALRLPLAVVRADCSALGSGDLGGRAPLEGIAPSREWWPYRNQLLATLAAHEAIRLGLREIIFATVQSDGFHADGTPGFFRHLDALSRYQEGGLGVSVPAIGLTSVELIRRAGVGADLLGWTHSCHTGNAACGVCRGCLKRLSVLTEAGLWP